VFGDFGFSITQLCYPDGRAVTSLQDWLDAVCACPETSEEECMLAARIVWLIRRDAS
jgi:hypothetical protein